ncbi:MAG TPA: SRPBCC domain-containing protein, partial [Iamia sp.]
MSPTGLTRDAGWEIGVSRTFPTSLEETWDVVVDEPGLARWLGPGAVLPDEVGAPYRTDDGAEGELRSLRPLDRVRLTWQPDGRAGRPTTVQVVVQQAASGTSVRFHQEHLADADERERQRA